MTSVYTSRILVMDLRADRIGYAAFELPMRLIDYGASRFDSLEAARARVDFLLGIFRPSALVLRKIRIRSTRRRPRWRSILRAIQSHARGISLLTFWVSEPALRRFFQGFHCRNKFQVAALLSNSFPELASKLPPKRKPYEPEPWTMTYFDAIALGVVYLAGGEPHGWPESDGTLTPAPHQLA
jgi:hypothetical protein